MAESNNQTTLNQILLKLNSINQKQNELETGMMSQASSNGDDSKSTLWKQMFDIKNTIAAVTLQIEEITFRVLQNAAQTDDIQQYQRRNCLIFHGLEDISKPKRNLQNESETINPTYEDFEKYMVNKINFLNLGIKISGKDIDTAHPLKTGSGKTPIIAKFTRRNVKHTIYASKKHLKDQDVLENRCPRNSMSSKICIFSFLNLFILVFLFLLCSLSFRFFFESTTPAVSRIG